MAPVGISQMLTIARTVFRFAQLSYVAIVMLNDKQVCHLRTGIYKQQVPVDFL